MGLYRRTDSPFWWIHIDGTDIKESTKVPHAATSAAIRKQNRELAQQIYHARMGDLARATHKLPARRSVGFQAHADWYAEHVLPTHRGAERERELLKPLRAFFGSDDLLTITPGRVREYATYRMQQPVRVYVKGKAARTTGRTVSASTVNREIGQLKLVMKTGVPTYFPVSPLAGMPALRTVKPKKRVLEPAEETRLLAALPTDADRAFYLVAIDSLMRLSNVINLRRDEDHGDHFQLTDSKTGPYVAIISARVRAALDALPTDTEYYFPMRRVAKTERDRRGAWRQLLQRACTRAGIPYGRAHGGITFHTGTRATGATRMIQAGHDVTTVQAVGNWQDVRSMADYLHTNRDRMRSAVESVAGPRNPDVNVTPPHAADSPIPAIGSDRPGRKDVRGKTLGKAKK